MERATAFYVEALGAAITFSSPSWTSLHIAGVRLGLFLHEREPKRVGLHVVVADLVALSYAITQAGGSIEAAIEVAPGVSVAAATDTEGNTFFVRKA